MQLTIVGLGVVGTSLGLALKAANPDISIIGHDPDGENVKRARKLGAIDKSHWNLISACEGSGLIVLDLSLEEVEKTLTAIQEYLAESTVIIDMSPVKRPVLELAQRILPRAQLIGGHVVSPRLLAVDADPSADLIQGATFYIIAPEDAPSAMLDLASNFVVAVGAKPQYIDVVEHDGLIAATLELPLLSALALMRAVTEFAGWEDRAKSVGGELAAVGSALVNAPPGMVDLMLANSEDVLRWLDMYMDHVGALRRLVASQDREGLGAMMVKATEAYLEGLAHGKADRPPVDIPGSSSFLRSMFLGKLGEPRKRPPDSRG